MNSRRRFAVMVAVAGLVAPAALFGGATGAGAAPGSGCPAVSTYFVTPTQLLPVSASGVIGTAVTLKQTYFDIAYSTDGTTLYGITSSAAKLIPVNPATGAEGTPITFTGDAVGQGANAMTSLPSGKVLVGTTALFELDPRDEGVHHVVLQAADRREAWRRPGHAPRRRRPRCSRRRQAGPPAR